MIFSVRASANTSRTLSTFSPIPSQAKYVSPAPCPAHKKGSQTAQIWHTTFFRLPTEVKKPTRDIPVCVKGLNTD